MTMGYQEVQGFGLTKRYLGTPPDVLRQSLAARALPSRERASANRAGARGPNPRVQRLLRSARQRIGCRPSFESVIEALFGWDGIAAIASNDLANLIEALAGPDLGSHAHPDRRRAVALACDRFRSELDGWLRGPTFRAAPLKVQQEAIANMAHRACERSVVLQSRDSPHTILLVGSHHRPPLMSYGRWPTASPPGICTGRVVSPDPFVERGWPTAGPYAEHCYDQTVFQTTLLEQSVIIETVERHFTIHGSEKEPADDAPDAPGELRAGRFRSFILELFDRLAKGRPHGGVIARQQYQR